MKTVVPPIKCQGIKTKLVPLIRQSAVDPGEGRWIEPFCGSCVVALNVRPARALLSDVNPHIIGFYRAIQDGAITASRVKAYLTEEGAALAIEGEAHYYAVRERFNRIADPLDFLFLSRACFNGVMRFNRFGKFNVPFCRKPDRFRPAYVTKIANQTQSFADVIQGRDWRFEVADFRQTLAQVREGDFVYADPPYMGRHADYFNSWRAADEADLAATLTRLPCQFLLSTWHSNQYRRNTDIEENWQAEDISIATFDHFYHVGATEKLRNAMIEALIANYTLPETGHLTPRQPEYAGFEQPRLGLGL